MFTLNSLAKGYNNAKSRGDIENKNLMGNFLLMQLMEDPRELLTLSDTRDIGIALFSISQESKNSSSESQSEYRVWMMLTFTALYKSLRQQPNDYSTKANLNMLWLMNEKTMVALYQNGLVVEHNINEPIIPSSKHYSLYQKINLLESQIKDGILDEHPNYLEFLNTIMLGIESAFKRVQ